MNMKLLGSKIQHFDVILPLRVQNILKVTCKLSYNIYNMNQLNKNMHTSAKMLASSVTMPVKGVNAK